MTGPAFNPSVIITALEKNHVDYVLVGGYAANLYGAVRPTHDIDLAPATTEQNLTRLVAALRELQAGIRVDDLPEGLPFDTSAEGLRGQKMLNLRTPHGDLDLTFSPAAFPAGYDDLIGQATPHDLDGVTVHVAALSDIIASKTEAARQKDIEALPELHQLAASHATVGDLARPDAPPGLSPGIEPDPPVGLDRGYS